MTQLEQLLSQLNRMRGVIAYYSIDLGKELIEQLKVKGELPDEDGVIELLQRVIPIVELGPKLTYIQLENLKVFIKGIEEGKFLAIIGGEGIIIPVALRILERY